MNTPNPIIEKIKKLLRMKRGGTPDEIATALRLAQELAEKHGIDLGQVNPDEETTRVKPITHGDETLGRRVSWECRYASLVIDQFFKVKVFQNVNAERSKYTFTFVGEEWDIQIAIYVYRFLCGHFRREWKTRKGRCRNRQAFLYGMYHGLCKKLLERQPAGAGLIRHDRALDYIKDRWGDLKTSSVVPDDDAEAARRAGFRAGQETEIRSGVKGGTPSAGMLSPAEGTKLLT